MFGHAVCRSHDGQNGNENPIRMSNSQESEFREGIAYHQRRCDADGIFEMCRLQTDVVAENLQVQFFTFGCKLVKIQAGRKAFGQ